MGGKRQRGKKAKEREKVGKENTGKKVFLLGHSMGGIAVQSYGIMYPGTVDGIVSSGGGTIVNVDGPDTEGATTITPDNLNFFARHALPQISQLLPMPS